MALLFHEDGEFVNDVGAYQKRREEMRHSLCGHLQYPHSPAAVSERVGG